MTDAAEANRRLERLLARRERGIAACGLNELLDTYLRDREHRIIQAAVSRWQDGRLDGSGALGVIAMLAEHQLIRDELEQRIRLGEQAHARLASPADAQEKA